jgi:virginiamycin B lyase
MRVLIGLSLFGVLAGAAPRDLAAVKKAVAPAAGVKTPGVRIPFANIKAEVEIPAAAKPAWVFFAESIFVPNAKDGLDKIDPKTGKIGDPVAGIAKPCAGMASGFTSLWIPSCADGSLVRLDAKTLKQTAKIAAGVAGVAQAIAASTDSVWLLTDTKTTLSRIDPDRNEVVAELRVPAGCNNLTFGETALWLVCAAENKIYRIDPATNLVANQIEVSAQPQALALGEGSVWVLCRKDGKVERIDPKTNKVTKTIELGVPGAEGTIAVGEGSVWVTMTGFPLARISPLADKEKAVQQFYGQGGGALQISPGAIWLSNVNEGTVWKIDPKRIAATLAE